MADIRSWKPLKEGDYFTATEVAAALNVHLRRKIMQSTATPPSIMAYLQCILIVLLLCELTVIAYKQKKIGLLLHPCKLNVNCAK